MESGKDKDDLADALARFASGEAPSSPEAAPSDHVPMAPKEAKPTRPAAPPGAPRTDPAVPPGTRKSVSPTPSSRPNAPGVQPPSPKPASPTSARNAPVRPKPPKPIRPDAPTLSQPPIESALPAPIDSGDISSSLANVIEDDDAVIVPAPEPAVFAHRPPPAPAKRDPFYARLSFRRTIIPILLTMGVALPGCAIWWLLQEEDSPLKSLGWQFPATLTVIGIVMLLLAILNMIQVKHAMDAQRVGQG